LPTCGQILQKFAILYALFALLVLPLGLGGVIGFYAKAHTTFDLAVLLETVVTAGMSGLFLGLDRKLQERAKLVEAGLLGLLKYY
jgi:hypothetical protein